jgi:hypothetical protein
MVETGQSRRFWPIGATSAYPLIATVQRTSREVRLVPLAAVSTCSKQGLFDHLIGAKQERLGDRQPDCLGGHKIDCEFQFGWLLNRNIAGFRSA